MTEQQNELPTLHCTNTHILLVEDNQVNQLIAKTMIKKYGCEVTIAADGSEAVGLCQTQSFDLIFMDCQMPILDGFAATIAIRVLEADAQRKAMPIVALTGNDAADDSMQCYGVGMNDYVKKPLSRAELERILLTWLPREKYTD